MLFSLLSLHQYGPVSYKVLHHLKSVLKKGKNRRRAEVSLNNPSYAVKKIVISKQP
jgi:hypothetical protein